MTTQRLLLLAMEKARAGVDFRPRLGAVCPFCQTARMKVTTTRPWEGEDGAAFRVRYHRCRNAACPLAMAGTQVKSIETDAE